MAQLTKYGLNEVNRVAAFVYMQSHLEAARECRQIWLNTFPAPNGEDLQIGIIPGVMGLPMVVHYQVGWWFPLCDVEYFDAELQFCKEQYEASRY